MKKRFTQAGGCLLAFAILIGFVFGAATREPMRGVLIGTIAGIVVAVLLWLVDRRRR
jgi:Na+/proline symporter